MKAEKIDFIKYIVVGLVIGLTISYGLDINWLNGVCIGLSLGLLLQKITTRIPEDDEIEVALFSLNKLLDDSIERRTEEEVRAVIEKEKSKELNNENNGEANNN